MALPLPGAGLFSYIYNHKELKQGLSPKGLKMKKFTFRVHYINALGHMTYDLYDVYSKGPRLAANYCKAVFNTSGRVFNKLVLVSTQEA